MNTNVFFAGTKRELLKRKTLAFPFIEFPISYAYKFGFFNYVEFMFLLTQLQKFMVITDKWQEDEYKQIIPSSFY
jgi:hypothetical protein